jgi:23S rRNA (guanosine2251-2'-O)-methyltransferase
MNVIPKRAHYHKDEIIVVFGRHAVYEAVTKAPHAVAKVLFEARKHDDVLKNAVRQAGIPMDGFPEGQPPRPVRNEDVHQGFIALVHARKLLMPYETFVASLTVSPETALVVLGELTDPHNVGAVIRSAAAFGVSGVIIPEHRQAPLTGTVIKVSAGMAFTVPLVTVGNVNQTVRDLKERGFWVYGLDHEATQSLYDETFAKPSVFILGNEGTGIREKTRELCDIQLRIPMMRGTESLNASASAAVALSAWSRVNQRAVS